MNAPSTKHTASPATILSNQPIPARHNLDNYLMELELNCKLNAQPGQFVEIQLSDPSDSQYRLFDYSETEHPVLRTDVGPDLKGKQPFLNRPFSIAASQTSRQRSQITVIYNVKGPGTEKLSRLQPGDFLTVMGPLGNRGFDLPDGIDQAVLVAGGIGLPPLLFWADHLTQIGISVVVAIGARSTDQLPLPDALIESLSPAADMPAAFGSLLHDNVDLKLATEDGSTGTAGRVTDLLKAILEQRSDTTGCAVYGCGPWEMLKSLAEVTGRHDLDCQVSLEQMMGCGTGLCQSCAVKVRTTAAPHWRYELCCTDGPVFSTADVIWD